MSHTPTAVADAASAAAPQNTTNASAAPPRWAGVSWHGVDLSSAVPPIGRLPPALEPPPLLEEPGLIGFAAGDEDEEDASPTTSPDHDDPTTNPFTPVLIRAAMAGWGEAQGDPALALATRAAYARWLAGRLGLRPVDTPAALGAALASNAQLAADLAAAGQAVAASQELAGVYGSSAWAGDAPGLAARRAWAAAEVGRLRTAAASAAASPPFAGALRLTLLSYRPSARLASPFSAGSSPGEEGSGRGGGGGGSARKRKGGAWFACCVAPAALDEEEEKGDSDRPARRSRWAASASHARRRPAAYAQAWLHAPAEARGGDAVAAPTAPAGLGSRSGRRSSSSSVPQAPPPPPLALSLLAFRTLTARRGLGAAWGVTSPLLAVPRPGCGLEVRVCDEVEKRAASRPSPSSSPAWRRRGLGGGAAGPHPLPPDPVIGCAHLALTDVTRALGRGGGGGTVWTLPLYSPPRHPASPSFAAATHGAPHATTTVGTPLVGGTPLLPAPGGPDPLPGVAAARGDLVGVVRVGIDFVCEDRTADTSAPPSTPALPTVPAVLSDPHAAFDELTAALWKDWRAVAGQLQALAEQEEEEEEQPGPLAAGLAARPASAPPPEPAPGALPPPPLPVPPRMMRIPSRSCRASPASPRRARCVRPPRPPARPPPCPRMPGSWRPVGRQPSCASARPGNSWPCCGARWAGGRRRRRQRWRGGRQGLPRS